MWASSQISRHGSHDPVTESKYSEMAWHFRASSSDGCGKLDAGCTTISEQLNRPSSTCSIMSVRCLITQTFVVRRCWQSRSVTTNLMNDSLCRVPALISECECACAGPSQWQARCYHHKVACFPRPRHSSSERRKGDLPISSPPSHTLSVSANGRRPC